MAVGERPATEVGTALLLIPTAVTVALLAVALVLDVAVGLQSKRALLHAAAGSANDAASLGVDESRLHRTGEICLDPERVATILAMSFADRPEVAVAADVVPTGCGTTVVVDLAGPTPRPFLRRAPIGSGGAVVRVQATARLAER